MPLHCLWHGGCPKQTICHFIALIASRLQVTIISFVFCKMPPNSSSSKHAKELHPHLYFV